jgi:ketosteroid isomerase-like protein
VRVAILPAVSESDVEVVRDQFAAVNERDFRRAMGHYADDVVLVIEDWGPNPGTYEGKEAVGEWFGDWFGTFGRDYRFEIVEARELGEGLIFLLVMHGGKGRASGAEAHMETTYLYRVERGKVARVQLFLAPADAHRAAALPEWSEGQTD